MRKPETKPTIRRINGHLRQLEARGAWSYQECVRARGNFAKLSNRRPRKRAA